MFQIAILLTNTDANVSLSFRTRDAAKGALAYLRTCKANDTEIDQMDDYGYVLIVDPKDVAYLLFVDVDQSQALLHDKNICGAKSAKKLAEQDSRDPEICELLGMPGEQRPRSKIIQ